MLSQSVPTHENKWNFQPLENQYVSYWYLKISWLEVFTHWKSANKSGLFLSSGKQVINIYQYLSLFLRPHLHTYNPCNSQQPTKFFKQIKHILYLPWLRSSNSFPLDLQLSKILTKAQETLHNLLSICIWLQLLLLPASLQTYWFHFCLTETSKCFWFGVYTLVELPSWNRLHLYLHGVGSFWSLRF